MFKFKELFIPLAALLLAACTAISTSIPTLTAHPESAPAMAPSLVPTGVSQPDLTLTPTLADSAQDQPNADVTYVWAILESDGTWTFYVTVGGKTGFLKNMVRS